MSLEESIVDLISLDCLPKARLVLTNDGFHLLANLIDAFFSHGDIDPSFGLSGRII